MAEVGREDWRGMTWGFFVNFSRWNEDSAFEEEQWPYFKYPKVELDVAFPRRCFPKHTGHGYIYIRNSL